jgi:hypothetical protein
MNKRWKNASLAILGTAAGAMVWSACDTTAFVSPKIRRLSNVRSTGAIAAQCNLTQPERNYSLRFVPISTDQRAIEPGERLVGFTVDLGGNFTVNDISILENSGTLYPAPDQPCATDANCVAAGLTDFTCAPLAPAESASVDAPRVCGRPIVMSVSTTSPLVYQPRLPAEDGRRRRSVVAMFFNGDSILGICPGTGLPGCRLDNLNQRAAGYTQALTTLFSENSPFAGGVEVCTGTYGAGSVGFLVPPGETSCFQRFGSAAAVSSGQEPYTGRATTFISRGEQNIRMNYLAGVREGIDQLLNGAQANSDLHLVVYADQAITDPDVLRDNAAFGVTVENLLQDAIDNGITIHAVQFDPPGSVFGRSGPLADLARLTCETGGTFQYAENPGSVSESFSSLGFTLPASYEAEVSLGVIGDVPRGPYRIATRMNVRVGNSTQLFDFGGFVASSGGRVDRRLLVQLNGCASTTECLDGYTCSAGICQAAGDFVRGGTGPIEEPEEPETPEVPETPEEDDEQGDET